MQLSKLLEPSEKYDTIRIITLSCRDLAKLAECFVLLQALEVTIKATMQYLVAF